MGNLAKPMPSQQELQEEFDYRDGNFYRKKANSNSVKVGSKAGCVWTNKRTGIQCVRIGFNHKLYQIHRLIWAWHGYSLEPNQEIDHVDGNSLNNRIENLRAATHKQNGENRKSANKNNKSGVKNVFWYSRAQKWIARIRVNGKNVFHQQCDTVEEAEALLKEVRPKYHGEFANDGKTKEAL